MRKRQHNKEFLAQNFLRSSKLVHRLVEKSSIGPQDTVIEIGPGHGIITAELARVAQSVIAVEKDRRLTEQLRKRFKEQSNVEIVENDFLKFQLPNCQYKILANIPYNVTAQIVRKLLSSRNPPIAAFLILQKEPAKKFAGQPRETLFSLTAKPYFEFEIVAALKRNDFIPVPNADSVLLVIRRRRHPLLSNKEFFRFSEFVKFGFTRWKTNLRSAFKSIFSYKSWKRLSHGLGFQINVTPTDLSFEQWIGLFWEFIRLQNEKLAAGQPHGDRNHRDHYPSHTGNNEPRPSGSRFEGPQCEIAVHSKRTDRYQDRNGEKSRSSKRGPPFRKHRGRGKHDKRQSDPADEKN